MGAWVVKKSRCPCQNPIQIRINDTFSVGGEFFQGRRIFFLANIYK